jgi:hypothetical protein
VADSDPQVVAGGRRLPESEVGEHRGVVVERVSHTGVVDVEQADDPTGVDDQLCLVEVTVNGGAAESRTLCSRFERGGEVVDAPSEVWSHNGEHRCVAERIGRPRGAGTAVERHRAQPFQQLAVRAWSRPRRRLGLDALSERFAGQFRQRHPALHLVHGVYTGNGETGGEQSFVALDEWADLGRREDLDVDHGARRVADPDDGAFHRPIGDHVQLDRSIHDADEPGGRESGGDHRGERRHDRIERPAPDTDAELTVVDRGDDRQCARRCASPGRRSHEGLARHRGAVP